MNQSKIDSMMESGLNVAIGFVTSMALMPVFAWICGVEMHAGQQMGVVGLFTITSIARSYAIRRAFNGRSAWEAMRCFGKS